jgi:hypothetical protein
VPRGGVLTDGFEALTNTGNRAVTVKNISLVDPRALRILASYIVPIAGHDLYGVRSGFPPAAHLEPGILWSKRQRIPGASIPPSHAGHVANLVVVVKPANSGGRASGINVDYAVSESQYRVRTNTALHVVVGRSCGS